MKPLGKVDRPFRLELMAPSDAHEGSEHAVIAKQDPRVKLDAEGAHVSPYEKGEHPVDILIGLIETSTKCRSKNATTEDRLDLFARE